MENSTTTNNNTNSEINDQQMIQIPAHILTSLLERVATLESIIKNNPQITTNPTNINNKNIKNTKNTKTNKSNQKSVTSTPTFEFNIDHLKPTVKEHEKRTPLGTSNDSQWADLFKKNNNNNNNNNTNNNKNQNNIENLEKTNNKKTKKQENHKKYFSNTKVGVERAHRAFSEPATTPSSYEFIHIPCNRRISKPDARALLQQLGIQQSRVIDIQFPARNTVSFFVHSEFAPKFRELPTKQQFKEKKQFSFFDGTIIANPAFATLGQAEKEKLAKEIYSKRMVRLCTERLVVYLEAAIYQWMETDLVIRGAKIHKNTIVLYS